MRNVINQAVIASMMLLGVTMSANSQTFTGPTELCANIPGGSLYTYFDDVSYTTVTWSTTGGASIVSGSGLSRNIAFTSDGTVTVQLKNSGGVIVSQGTKNVTAYVPGTLSAPSSLCSGSSVTINSSGGNGPSYVWRYSTNGGSTFTTLPDTGPTLIHTPTTTTLYRRYVNGCHPGQISNTVTVAVDPTTVAGTLTTANTALCTGGTPITLIQGGHTGVVTEWKVRYREGAGSFGPWNTYATDNVTSKNVSPTHNGNDRRTYEYVNTIQSGTCSAATTAALTVTIDPPTNAGTLSPLGTDHYTNTNSGTITLSGRVGSVVRWEQNTGSGWTTISNTTATQGYTNLAQTTSYRAIVKSGVCSEAASGAAEVRIYPSPTITATSDFISYGGRSTLSTTSSYATYQWIRNSVDIGGANSSTYVVTGPGTYKVRVVATGATSYGESQDKVISSSFDVADTELSRNLVSTTAILTPGVTSTSDLYAEDPLNLSQSIQYMDEIGRTIQVVGVRQSPAGKDMVLPTGYTAQGRIETSYLPYEASVSDGLYKKNAIRGTGLVYSTSDQYLFYHGASGITNDDYPFSLKVTSASPLLTLKEQGAPGYDWQPGLGGHTVKQDGILNTASQVRKWNAAGVSAGYYNANELAVSQITDQNNHKVLTFTDKLGQVILKKVEADGNVEAASWLETYYIYDEYGRVKYQVPPKAILILGTVGTLDAGNTSIQDLVFKYTYDARGRLTQKKVPGKAVDYFVYDNLDRLVLTQDGNLRAGGKWFFTKYDIKRTGSVRRALCQRRIFINRTGIVRRDQLRFATVV